jgi:hypothetical protein
VIDDEDHTAKGAAFREHEKFWAFVCLIVTIVGLVYLASTFDRGATATDLVMQAKLRIIDSAIAGLLTITGMAAQALFRVSSTDKQNAVTFAKALDQMPAPPKEVTVVNPPDNPANVTEAHHDAPPASDAGIPDYAR